MKTKHINTEDMSRKTNKQEKEQQQRHTKRNIIIKTEGTIDTWKCDRKKEIPNERQEKYN